MVAGRGGRRTAGQAAPRVQSLSSIRPVELVALALVVAHNWASNRMLPRWAYVPVNLAVSGSLVALARSNGVSWDSLGLSGERAPDGLRVGLQASVALVALVAAGLALPLTRDWFRDDRVLLQGNRQAAYDASVHIPLGTALSEEATFRAALLALSARQRSLPASIALTSALFGLWHILPTMHTLPLNSVLSQAQHTGSAAGVVGGSVLATGLAGAALAGLRVRSGSVLAPVMAHAALNVSAYVGARLVHGRRATGIVPAH